MAQSLAAFVAVSVVVIVTPGPDTALTIRNALWRGWRGGVLTALGVASGQVCWAVATAVGLAALLRASEPLFDGLRWVGAAYLVWLGVQALRAAWRSGAAGSAPEHAARGSGGRAFRQGLLSNLANPKMGVFFVTLLPQFSSDALSILLLGALFAAMTFVWLSAYGWVVTRIGDLLRSGRRLRRALDAVTGVALVGLGVSVAAER